MPLSIVAEVPRGGGPRQAEARYFAERPRSLAGLSAKVERRKGASLLLNLERRTAMVRELTCRRMLITGASSGIGRCLAEQAALEGACVAAAARSADRLEELAAALR